jgi:uncharacterized protein (UPF0332 family)
MSPRSEEFIDQARERLEVARQAFDSRHPTVAVSVAYYAMLNAARAALSEDDQHARTHRGAWNLFRERYVVTDAFDDRLYTLAQHAQTAREGGDYEAVVPSEEEAKRYVEGAADFIAAIEGMLEAADDSKA